MFLRLLFLLTFIPFVEVYLLVRLGGSLGWMNTFSLIIISGVAGAWLLRQQGHSIFVELQQSSQQNQIPSKTLAKGLFTFLGGVLLLTPGFLTDAIGLSLILPGTQALWRAYFMSAWKKGMANGNVRFYSSGSPFGGQNPFQNQGPFSGGPNPFDPKQDPRMRGQNPFEPQSQKRPTPPGVIDIEAQSVSTEDKKDS